MSRYVSIRRIIGSAKRAGVPINQDALLMDAWQHTWTWTLAHPTWALWGVIGLILGGVTHSVADMIVSWAKRVW